MAAVRLLRLKGMTDPNVDPATGMWMSGTYRKPVVQNPAPVLPGQNLPPEVTAIPGAKPAKTKPAKYGPQKGVNAKTLAFDQPGAGNAGYNVDASNVYGLIEKLRPHATEKAGGSKQLWDNLSRWTSTPQVAHLNRDQQVAFDQYMKTGKKPDNLKDRTTLLAFDWALRDVARGQQHKQGFLDSFLGKLVVIGLEAGATLVTGNPMAGAAVGAAAGYVKDHSLVGAVMGGIEGYGVGSATNWVANGGLSGLTQPVGGGTTVSGQTIVDKGVNVLAHGVDAVNGATSGLTVGGALTAINAGSSIKGWLQGGATAAAVASVMNRPDVKPNLGEKPAGTTPPPVTVSPEERQAEMFRRRRAAVQTDLTWGNALTAPLELAKPQLLGAPLRLAA